MPVMGIDIGGSGIKANLVDVSSGDLVAERHKILTPQPSTPETVAEVVGQMVAHFGYSGPIGCTFPAIVKNGVTLSAANVDDRWIGMDAQGLFTKVTGLPVTVLNDADAAGMAEVAFGAGRGQPGVVIVLTFGTGIGSAMFVDGALAPNTELGHLNFRGFDSAEDWVSARAKEDGGLSYKQWAVRLDDFLEHLDRLFSPELVIIGGGISRRWEKFGTRLGTKVPVVAALLQNEAGIVGAAMAAQSRSV